MQLRINVDHYISLDCWQRLEHCCVLHFWLCHKQVLLKYITRRFCPESETDFLNWIADEYMNPTCISGTISPKYKVVFMFSLVTIPSMKCHVCFFVPGNQATRMQGCDSLGSIMTLIWAVHWTFCGLLWSFEKLSPIERMNSLSSLRWYVQIWPPLGCQAGRLDYQMRVCTGICSQLHASFINGLAPTPCSTVALFA